MGIALEGAEDFKVSVLQRDVTIVRIKCLCCRYADRIKNDLSKWRDCLKKFVRKLQQNEGFYIRNNFSFKPSDWVEQKISHVTQAEGSDLCGSSLLQAQGKM